MDVQTDINIFYFTFPTFYFFTQLRQIRVTQTEEGELDEEAEWIYKQAFTTKLISKLSDHGEGQYSYYQPKSVSAINKIRDALNFMRNHLHEVSMKISFI